MSEDVKAPAVASTEASPVTPAAVETPKETSQEDGSRWAHLVRKEKAQRAEATRLQALKADLEKQRATPAQPDWKERIKSDPLGMFAEAGLSQDDLVQLAMNAKPEDMSIRQLKAEIAALKAETSGIRTSAEEMQKQSYDSAIKQISREVTLLVDSDESFETIKAMGQQDDVVKLIESTYKDEGTLLSTEEAAKQVEERLVEQALTLAKLKKIQARLAPPPPPAPVVPETKQSFSREKNPITVTPSTLSHKLDTSSAGKPMTSKERRDRAIKAFYGQLKSE